jgi:hypothetical protein
VKAAEPSALALFPKLLSKNYVERKNSH